jgi:hypothetical protein
MGKMPRHVPTATGEKIMKQTQIVLGHPLPAVSPTSNRQRYKAMQVAVEWVKNSAHPTLRVALPRLSKVTLANRSPPGVKNIITGNHRCSIKRLIYLDSRVEAHHHGKSW